MSIIATIKEHKALSFGALVAVLFLLYVIRHSSGGSTATAPGTDPSQVQAATDLQNAQLAASSAANQTGAALQANATNDATQIQLATIAAQQSGAHDALAAGVATSDINANEQIQSLLGSLSADVSKTGINADVSKTSILATNQTQQQQILADALVTQSTNQTNANIAAINATKDIATQSWLSKIF